MHSGWRRPRSCIFSSLCGSAAAKMATALKHILRACDRTVSFLRDDFAGANVDGVDNFKSPAYRIVGSGLNRLNG
jgi:hypothetical protein